MNNIVLGRELMAIATLLWRCVRMRAARYEDSTGATCLTGGTDLKRSQAYPEAFGVAIASAFDAWWSRAGTTNAAIGRGGGSTE